MPLYYTSPNVRTDKRTPELVPEPVANALQKQLHNYITVPSTPMYMPIPGIQYPGTNINYGHVHQYNDFNSRFRKPWPYPPLQSPGVTYVKPGINPNIVAASIPQPQAGATGVYTSLRAPGINEGF